MYSLLFRLILSRMDPEWAHDLAAVLIRILGSRPLASLVRGMCSPSKSLAVEALGVRFPSPFGVAAGFDKNATMAAGLWALGFGHVEVGTVTAHPQDGNPKPRLFRLIPDRAVINRMGFNNRGADAAAVVLQKLRRRRRRPILGVNIGKSRITPVEDATGDYVASARLLAPLADYLAVNVSSPNTPGLRGLQELDVLKPLLAAIREAAGGVPILVKIAPDLSDDQLVRIAELVRELGLAGVIATNTTIAREGLLSAPELVDAAGAGGLSGVPLAARSLEVLRVLRGQLSADFCVISVGGVETAVQVRERLHAGATLVQGYTGFLYRGPFWARQINKGLALQGSSEGIGPV